MQLLISRSTVALCYAGEKNRNMHAHLVPHTHNSTKDILENLLPV